jgi:hypothetical protein
VLAVLTWFWDESSNAFVHLCWFISMALGNSFHWLMPSAIVVPIVLTVAPFVFSRYAASGVGNAHSAIWPIAVLPWFWVAIGLLGGIFRAERWPPVQHGAETASLIFVLTFVIFGIYVFMQSRGRRVLALCLIVANAYLVLVVDFIAGMSISGSWL